MKLNEDSITYAAYAFAYFLSASLMKYVLYDNGFAFSNILLIIGLAYIRIYFLSKESFRLQESASFIMFVLFDKNLVDVGNVFLLLGVSCIREQFHENLLYKETISFSCGLVFLLMGWFSVGRIFVIYPLMLFYYYHFTLISCLADFWKEIENFVKGKLDSV